MSSPSVVTRMRAEPRPKLLFLSQGLPYPPDSGAKIRTYHILRLLADAFEITALCFYRYKPGLFHTDVAAAVDALGEFGAVEAFPIPQEHSRLRLLWDHSRSVLTQRAYTVFAYQSSAFLRQLRTALSQQRFDLVHADSLDLSRYFPEVGSRPIICTHHDAQSVLLRRRAAAEREPLRRRFVGLQARLTEDEEQWWCPRVALNLTVSEVDQVALQAVAPGARFAVVPNGVDLVAFSPGTQVVANSLVAVGGLVTSQIAMDWTSSASRSFLSFARMASSRRFNGSDGPPSYTGVRTPNASVLSSPATLTTSGRS